MRLNLVANHTNTICLNEYLTLRLLNFMMWSFKISSLFDTYDLGFKGLDGLVDCIQMD